MVCFLAMQTTNIASIAICAQLFDNLLIKLFHRTCGIQVYPSAAFVCVSEQLPSASPFSGVLIMSTGALVALMMIVPLCLLNLSENIWLQIGSCILILLIFVQWIVTIMTHGLTTMRVPAFGSNLSQTFGAILFNYAFVTAVPSFANAKQPHVSAHKTVGSGVSIMTVLYVLVAILGGMAYEIPDNSSMIQVIGALPDVTILSQIVGYTFPIVALVTSIPVNTIVLRYNLIQSGTCNKTWSNLLAGALPWFFAIPGMTGSGLTKAVGWCSLLFVSAANFVVPFVLYIYSKKHREKLRQLDKIEAQQQETLRVGIKEASMDSTAATGAPLDSCRGWNRSAFWSRVQSFGSFGAQKENEIETMNEKTDTMVDSQDQEKSFVAKSSTPTTENDSLHLGTVITPPFLNGHNYSIPGFHYHHHTAKPIHGKSSDLELQRSQTDEASEEPAGTGLRGTQADDGGLPHHMGELDTFWSLRAIPRWVPVSGLKIAWGALLLLICGIGATIV